MFILPKEVVFGAADNDPILPNIGVWRVPPIKFYLVLKVLMKET